MKVKKLIPYVIGFVILELFFSSHLWLAESEYLLIIIPILTGISILILLAYGE